MLNITTAKPHLVEISKQITRRALVMENYAESYKHYKNPQDAIAKGIAIGAHIAELKELRYQLAMTPEKVYYLSPILPSHFDKP